ncbi:MAG TPA: hypothetical protein VMJ35_04380 [Dongiaceae bacterium]|nr:hypothetical protein [Dongiaceae bacterium]
MIGQKREPSLLILAQDTAWTGLIKVTDAAKRETANTCAHGGRFVMLSAC